MEAVSLTSLVSPLLGSEKFLLFSMSDLEIVSKKVAKCHHCKCETENSLSQAWSHSLHLSIIGLSPFSPMQVFFPKKRRNIYLCSITVMVVLENDSVWIVTTPDKGQDDKFVAGERESSAVIAVGWEIRDLASGSMCPPSATGQWQLLAVPIAASQALADLAHWHRFAALDHPQCFPPPYRTPDVVVGYCVSEAVPVTDKLLLDWNICFMN